MSAIGTRFITGQTLKADHLNLMVDAINDNNTIAQAAQQQSQTNANEISAIKDKDVDISESEFEALQEAGELDESKTYYIYEE